MKNAPLRDSVKLLSSKGEHSPALGLISVFLQIYLGRVAKMASSSSSLGMVSVILPSLNLS